MVSVIIPVYNAEKYLRRCLDSVVNQTYKDIEIIVVDDGSTDGSAVICDEYAARDNRFIVIHQKNGGVSVARQTGLEAVKGDYICFVDADDCIDSKMIDELFQEADTTNSDMIICDYYAETESGWIYSSQKLQDKMFSEEVIRMILSENRSGSCWNKFIRRACCVGINFTPSDLIVGEDELYIIKILSKGITVRYLPKAFYRYYRNSNSIINTFNEKAVISKIKEVKELEIVLDGKAIKEECLYSQKKETLRVAFLSKHLSMLLKTFPEIHEKVIAEGRKYNYKSPISPCLSIALRGYPKIAYWICKINLYFIIQVKKIKSYL